MIARTWLSLVLVLSAVSFHADANGAEPERAGVVADGPQFKLSFHVVERVVPDSRTSQQSVAPRTLTATEVKVWFNALQNDRNNKVMSSPTIVTVDRRTALLTVGGERLFTVGYDADQPITKAVPVGIRLSTTPTQFDDGRVRLEFAMHTSRITDVVHAESAATPPDAPRPVELPTAFEQTLSSTLLLPVGGAAVVNGETHQTDGKRFRTEVLVTIERFDAPR